MTLPADTLLIFGATGDLAQRMLLPSLCALDSDGLVSPNLRIVGTARSDYSDETYRAFAGQALGRFLPEHRKASIAGFLPKLTYQHLDASEISGFDALAAKVGPTDKGAGDIPLDRPQLFEPTIAV